MKLFRNKKVEDLEEKVQSIFKRLDLVEYELNNPKPYKIGDNYDKDNIVTNVELKRRSGYSFTNRIVTYITWEIETTNKKTGKKNIIFK